MHWVEFALQGVRGFLPSVRVSLKPGYWTLLPNTPGAPLVGLTSELCFPDGRGSDARYASAEGGNTSKAALWIVGRDRATYRILRELGRSGALHRVNPTSRGHDLVTEEPTEMAQYLRAQVGFPPRGRYETLFTFTPGQLPSKRPRRSAGPAARAGAAGFTPAPETPIDPAQARARLAELEKEMALSTEVERLQFRADGVSAQVFQLETKLNAVQTLEKELAHAQQGLQQAPTVEGLGLIPDIVERAKGFSALVAKVDETLARLEGERQVDVVNVPDGDSTAARRAILGRHGARRRGAVHGGEPDRSPEVRRAARHPGLRPRRAGGAEAGGGPPVVPSSRCAGATGSAIARSRCGSSSRPTPSRCATR